MILERRHKFNFDNMKLDFLVSGLQPEEVVGMFKDMLHMRQIYNAAMKEISTKLEILDDEFLTKHDRNPIHHMECRLKQPQSIFEKLKRKNLDMSVDSAMKNITDIAGIRVICHYISDIYTIANLLLKQDDVMLIKKTDYIENPKANGYRSLHLVVSIPVFLSEETQRTAVEIQIRTIAMDFWASLEHELRYKSDTILKENLQNELTDCA